MKCIAVILLFAVQAVWGQSKVSIYKKWKTFRSDVGYEFKYPNCWKIDIDSPDEDGPLHTIRDIAVNETSHCSTKLLSKDIVPNGIGFSGGWGPKERKIDANKEIKSIENSAHITVQRGDWLVFKKFKLDKADAVGWVETFPVSKNIRWKIKVYCPDWWVSVGGPTIDYVSVPKSMYAKFKEGDLALPEPYKTIINSIRCIPAKHKK